MSRLPDFNREYPAIEFPATPIRPAAVINHCTCCDVRVLQRADSNPFLTQCEACAAGTKPCCQWMRGTHHLQYGL